MKHHHHRAEDGREDAALGVRLARLVGDEVPEPARVDGGPPGPGEPVRRVGPVDVERPQLLLPPVHRPEDHLGAGHALHLLGELLLELRVAGLLLRLALVELPPRGGEVAGAALLLPVVQLAPPEADPLDLVVHRPDLVLLDRLHRAAVAGRLGHEPGQERPDRLRPGRDLLPALDHLDRHADERPVLAPLDEVDPRGLLPLRDLRLVDPAEVDPVEVPVTDLELHAVLPGVVGPVGVRDRLALHGLAGQLAAVLQGELLDP